MSMTTTPEGVGKMMMLVWLASGFQPLARSALHSPSQLCQALPPAMVSNAPANPLYFQLATTQALQIDPLYEHVGVTVRKKPRTKCANAWKYQVLKM